jgi:hypothetical protein
VVAADVGRDVHVDDVAVFQLPLVGDAMADDLAGGGGGVKQGWGVNAHSPRGSVGPRQDMIQQ